MEPAATQSQEPGCLTSAQHTKPIRHSDLVVDNTIAEWTPPDQINSESSAFRRELGLPTDQPIVMTGHQPVFWHAGILVKYMVCDAIATRASAAGSPTTVAWCVPDHVTADPGSVTYPSQSLAAGSDRWHRVSVDLFRETSDLPPALADARARLIAEENKGSLAERQVRAHAEILGERAGLSTPHPVIFATRFGRTSLFQDMVSKMASDPTGCVTLYNKAAAAFPNAGVRPLSLGLSGSGPSGIDPELPIWRIAPGGTPESIRASELADADKHELVPRALLFTGMLRAHACDLFVHGTGGGIYDQVTEQWISDWCGWSLAPAGVATATLTLDLGIPDVSRTDLQQARWRAHSARHNPRILGEDPSLLKVDQEKQALLARIREAPRGTRDAMYFEMHRKLGQMRKEHAQDFARLDTKIDKIIAAMADQDIAQDRTWPWILQSDTDVASLRNAVLTLVGPEAVSLDDEAQP